MKKYEASGSDQSMDWGKGDPRIFPGSLDLHHMGNCCLCQAFKPACPSRRESGHFIFLL
jgi:hypothetical protein